MEDVLSLASFSKIPFPFLLSSLIFSEDLVFPYCLWGHQNPSLCPSLTPTPEFLLSLLRFKPRWRAVTALLSPYHLPIGISNRFPISVHLLSTYCGPESWGHPHPKSNFSGHESPVSEGEGPVPKHQVRTQTWGLVQDSSERTDSPTKSYPCPLRHAF